MKLTQEQLSTYERDIEKCFRSKLIAPYLVELRTNTTAVHDIFNAIHALGIAAGKAEGEDAVREKSGYAGVTIWSGDKAITTVATKTQIEQGLGNPLRSLAEECLRQII